MKRTFWIILTTIWIALIYFNSTRIGSSSSATSGVIVQFVQKVLSVVNIQINSDILSLLIRKGAHFFEFFLLGIFSYNIIKTIKLTKHTQIFYGKVTVYSYIIVLGFCMLIATIDESIQYFIPGRASSLIDVLIDFSGSLFAILLIVLLNYKKIKSTLNNDDIM